MSGHPEMCLPLGTIYHGPGFKRVDSVLEGLRARWLPVVPEVADQEPPSHPLRPEEMRLPVSVHLEARVADPIWVVEQVHGVGVSDQDLGLGRWALLFGVPHPQPLPDL